MEKKGKERKGFEKQKMPKKCDGEEIGRITALILLSLFATPSVLNYKLFQESWRVKPSQSLTKIIERNIKIFDIK